MTIEEHRNCPIARAMHPVRRQVKSTNGGAPASPSNLPLAARPWVLAPRVSRGVGPGAPVLRHWRRCHHTFIVRTLLLIKFPRTQGNSGHGNAVSLPQNNQSSSMKDVTIDRFIFRKRHRAMSWLSVISIPIPPDWISGRNLELNSNYFNNFQ